MRPDPLTTAALCLAAVAIAACDPTLPPAPPHALVVPDVHAVPISVCWAEYAHDTAPGSYGLAGDSDELHWDITFSGLVIRHPRGDVVVDVGNSSHFADEIATSSLVPRLRQRLLQGSATLDARAPDALRSVGVDPSSLRAIALSHVHADHAGGALDLPGIPVLLSAEEIAFVAAERDLGGFHVVRAQADAIAPRARPIQFSPVPYETFDVSADYFGDGSVVFVPLPGHTPGSVGTFVNRSKHERYFHVGDAVDTIEAIEKRRGKGTLLEGTDVDSAQADRAVAKLTQLRAVDPELVILPAHDRKAWRAAFGAPGRCVGGPVR
jgi:N-acyl homoserine lactone hydrolase